jgi:hypothetical protein
MSVSFIKKSRLFHKFILTSFRNIKVFVKYAQNLNTHAEKFGEVRLTDGI